jgi:DNA-binding transcriptional MerR regulator
MEQEIIGIREMCEHFGVTPRTLRFYETKELLSPQRVGARRLYGHRDRIRMALILRGKRYGLSLETIRELLDLSDQPGGPRRQLEESLAVGKARLVELERERDELDRVIAELKQDIADCTRVLEGPDPMAGLPRHWQEVAA